VILNKLADYCIDQAAVMTSSTKFHILNAVRMMISEIDRSIKIRPRSNSDVDEQPGSNLTTLMATLKDDGYSDTALWLFESNGDFKPTGMLKEDGSTAGSFENEEEKSYF
jgi:hypothetical protein